MHHFDRCLIHAGMPKTGSTSLQTFLAVNRKALLARGVLYPVSLGWRNHVRLAAALHPGPTPQLAIALSETGARDADDLRARLEAGLEAEVAAACAACAEDGRPPPSTLVLSSEFFWSLPEGDAMLAALRAFADARAPRTEALIYLRRQDLFAVSMASTRARDGEPGEGFAAPIFPDVPRRAYRYAKCLDGFAAAFGKDAVTARLFDRAELAGGDVIADALEAWGLGPIGALTVPPRRNPALRPAMQAWLGHLGAIDPARHGRDAGPDRIDLSAVTERHGGLGRRPSRAEAEAFLARFEAGNEKVRAAWFPERSRLFDTDMPWPEEPDPIPSAADLMAVTHDALMVKEAEIARLAARLALAEGRAPEALAQFHRSARLHPGRVATALHWGEAALAGDAAPEMLRLAAAEVALALVDCGGGEHPRIALRLLLGRLHLRAGDVASAVLTAEALVSDRPRFGPAARLAERARKAAQG